MENTKRFLASTCQVNAAAKGNMGGTALLLIFLLNMINRDFPACSIDWVHRSALTKSVAKIGLLKNPYATRCLIKNMTYAITYTQIV